MPNTGGQVSVKKVSLMQVVSGGQKSFWKKTEQVCDGQNYCLFVGDKYLISALLYK